MTIKRSNRIVIFVCDECEEELDTDTDDFDEARRTAYDNGWRTRKDRDGWTNLCMDCAE